MFIPQTRCSLFELAITEDQRPSPPLVCRHPHRQKGQFGGTFKRRKAQWWSSSKVQSDSAEAHLCLSPTVCLYLWLWLRAGQYTEIFRLSLIRTGTGWGRGCNDPEATLIPGSKKQEGSHMGHLYSQGVRERGGRKGALVYGLFPLLFFFIALMQAVHRHAWRLARLHYNIKTTTDQAERVKAKQHVVRYHFSRFPTENDGRCNQCML